MKGPLSRTMVRGNLPSMTLHLKPPSGLSGGIMYQIFPDRFYNSGTPKANVPEDRKLHEQWGEQPDWQPDAQEKSPIPIILAVT